MLFIITCIFNSHSFMHVQTIQSEANDSYSRLLIGEHVCMKECELIKSGHTFGLLAVI